MTKPKAPTKKQIKEAERLLANGGLLPEIAERTGMSHDDVLALINKEDA